MTDYAYLVHLLYCAVHDTQPQEKPEEVSFKSVLEYGKLHEVANIAYLSVEKLKNKPEAEILNEWKLYYYFSVQRDMRQKEAYENIISLLHENGIRTLEAQGTVTKTLYPSPELRMMSDIDFIIDRENLKRTGELMCSLGYDIEENKTDEIDVKKENGQIIEFHSEFFSEKIYGRRERFSKAINSPFSHAKPDGDNELKYNLDDTYFYLYSILHILKHFETAGCGIRRILDIYYLKKALSDRIDGAYINGVIDSYGFRENTDLLFALEGEWFEGKPSSKDLSEVAVKVFESLNHGTRNVFAQNEVHQDIFEGVKFARLKRIITFIFPKKERVCLNYPECRERGYSTVTCWFYRLYRKLTEGRIKAGFEYIRILLKK